MITLKQLEAISASKGDMPAEEWAALLETCPEWVARRDAREAEMLAKEERYLEEERPLREELCRLGYPVKWVWDFVNSAQSYPDAIPTLIDHLQCPYSDEIREGIVRSLAVREARGLAGHAIVAVLGENGLGDQLRWALANTLTIVADRTNLEAIKLLLEIETNKDVSDRLRRSLKAAAKP